MDPYTVLQLPKHATVEEIRKSYIRLSLYYHPDRNMTASKEKQENCKHEFQKISNAYHQLTEDKDNFGNTFNTSHDFYCHYFTKILKKYNLENKTLYEIFENIELDKSIKHMLSGLSGIFNEKQYTDNKIEKYTVSITLDEYYYHQYKRIHIPNSNNIVRIDLDCTEQEIILQDNSKVYIILKDIHHSIYKRINGYDLFHKINIDIDLFKNGFQYELTRLDGSLIHFNFDKPYKYSQIYVVKGEGLKEYTSKNKGDLYLQLQINKNMLEKYNLRYSNTIKPIPLDVVNMLFNNI
jgi:DnaJ-class molecular chaperone